MTVEVKDSTTFRIVLNYVSAEDLEMLKNIFSANVRIPNLLTKGSSDFTYVADGDAKKLQNLMTVVHRALVGRN